MTEDVRRVELPWDRHAPRPLGRHVEHDERSRAFKVFPEEVPAPITVFWQHTGDALDQLALGSCTGNAGAQNLNTAPLRRSSDPLRTEDDAVTFYSEATRVDGFDGAWPPEDTGSSGIAVAKVLRRHGLVSSYRHAFGLAAALAALRLGPLMVGTVWRGDMFTPDDRGFITPTGEDVGGHEWTLLGVDVRGGYVEALNSWGPRWGLAGRFRLRIPDFGDLLSADGDVIQLRRTA